MIGSIGISLGWLIIGTISEASGYTYLGIEPFYPGLATSILFWLIGRRRGEDLLEETDFTKEALEDG